MEGGQPQQGELTLQAAEELRSMADGLMTGLRQEMFHRLDRFALSLQAVVNKKIDEVQAKEQACVRHLQEMKLKDEQFASMKREINAEKESLQNLKDQVSGPTPGEAAGKVVTFNVGGRVFTSTLATLTRFEPTFLSARFSGRFSDVKDDQSRSFIDRDPELFSFILQFLRDPDQPFIWPDREDLRLALIRELEFYGLSDAVKQCEGGGVSAMQAEAVVGQSPRVSYDYNAGNVVNDGASKRAVNLNTTPTRSQVELESSCDPENSNLNDQSRLQMPSLGAPPQQQSTSVTAPAQAPPAAVDRGPGAGLLHNPFNRPSRANRKKSKEAQQTLASSWETGDMKDASIFIAGGYGKNGYIQSCRTVSFALDSKGPCTDSWTRAPDLAEARSHVKLILLEDCIWTVGGYGSERNTSLERLNQQRQVWEDVTSLPIPRRGIAGCSSSRWLYTLGGHDGSQSVPVVERYAPSTRSWETVAPMEHARRAAAAEFVASDGSDSGLLLAFGGKGPSQVLQSSEAYDTETGQWHSAPPLHTGRYWLASTVLDKCVYAVGGHDGKKDLQVVERYDPRMSSWLELPPPKHCKGVVGVCAGTTSLFVVGGSNGKKELTTIEQFDLRTNTWMKLGTLDAPTRGVGAMYIGANNNRLVGQVRLDETTL